MNVDDFVKIILVVSISFSIAGISYQLMKLIGKLTGSVDELTASITNLNDFSTKLIDDYDQISKALKALTSSVSKFGTNVIDPLINVFSFLKQFKK